MIIAKILLGVNQPRRSVVPSGLSYSVCRQYNSEQAADILIEAGNPEMSVAITDVIISNGGTAGIAMLVYDPTGANEVILGDIYLPTNTTVVINLTTPIVVSLAKAVAFSSEGVTGHTITMNYYLYGI